MGVPKNNLSKRETIALACMQGLLSNDTSMSLPLIIKDSFKLADEFLKQSKE